MRLLNSESFEIKEFVGDRIPEYAILSHTWEGDEVLFADMQDLQSGRARSKRGWSKVERFCQKAAEDGFEWCWIDTCCTI